MLDKFTFKIATDDESLASYYLVPYNIVVFEERFGSNIDAYLQNLARYGLSKEKYFGILDDDFRTNETISAKPIAKPPENIERGFIICKDKIVRLMKPYKEPIEHILELKE